MVSPRLMLKSFRSRVIAAYVSKPLKPGLPFGPGVASASPVMAKRTPTPALARGAVVKVPVGLVTPPWWKR